ncbi:hypothetical protein ES288_A06G048300v1, partial [Gossypium darwinii]
PSSVPSAAPPSSTVINRRFSISYCFLLFLQLLVQLKLPFNLRINIWYYRAPELIFGATIYTTTIDICSRYMFRC